MYKFKCHDFVVYKDVHRSKQGGILMKNLNIFDSFGKVFIYSNALHMYRKVEKGREKVRL